MQGTQENPGSHLTLGGLSGHQGQWLGAPGTLSQHLLPNKELSSPQSDIGPHTHPRSLQMAWR